MTENTNLWNTKVNDLTVGDSVKLTVATPILMMGGVMVAGMLITAASALAGKFRKTDSITTTEK